MRKVYLKLENENDLLVEQHLSGDGTAYWHLRNKNNQMGVVQRGLLCKSIVMGTYILDRQSRFTRDKLLAAMSYSDL